MGTSRSALAFFCTVFLCSPVLHAQNEEDIQAWIYLTDKGNVSHVDLDSRTLERRHLRGTGEVTDQDVAVFKPYQDRIRSYGVRIRTASRWLNAVSVEGDPVSIEAVGSLSFVKEVRPVGHGRRPNEQVEPPDLFGDRLWPQLRKLWSEVPDGLPYGPSRAQVAQINVTALHAQGLSGAGVTVCILDDGFQWDHPAFDGLDLLGQWDFVMQDDDVRYDPMDPYDYFAEHGTMTWSVLGGYAAGRIIGPAFGAQFLLGRTEDGRSETPLEEDYWIAGLEWCEANGADIASSSLGYLKFDDPRENHEYEELDGQTIATSIAANFAAERGVFVVNSAGNEGPAERTLTSPADAFGAIAVGAVGPDDTLAFFSSRGPVPDFQYTERYKPEVLALGVRNFVATNTGYGRASGTSFSAPLVAGAAALLLEAHPDWTPNQLREALTMTASQSSWPDHHRGYGLINLLAAVEYEPAPDYDRTIVASVGN